MTKKLFILIQHKLIPVALMAGNMALIHFIYLLAMNGNDYFLMLTAVSLGILAAGILKPNKYILVSGIFFYLLILIFSLA